MSRVDFYILPDKGSPQRYACLIAGKARKQGRDIHIHTTSREDATQLDDLLWTHKDISFLPHSLIDDKNADNTSISIGWTGVEPRQAEVLINLDKAIPEFATRYARIVEFVPAEPTLKQQARSRFKKYRESGFELHDHSLKDEHV